MTALSIPTRSVPTIALLAGKVAPFRGPDEPSAIVKQPLSGPVTITPRGIAGDEQADRVHHGGPDMAIHHYAFDHYAYWRGQLGEHPLLGQPGAFGENISTTGLAESTVFLGDRFRLGTALIEVSQGRQPCWKQGHRLGHPEMPAQIVQTRRCTELPSPIASRYLATVRRARSNPRAFSRSTSASSDKIALASSPSIS